MKPILFGVLNCIDLAIESMEKQGIDKNINIGEVKKSIYLSHQDDLDSLNFLELAGNFGTINDAIQVIKKYSGIKDYKDITFIEAKKEMILAYKDNPLMNEVLSGKSTLEKITQDISGFYRGIKKFLPHPKNKEHNQRVESLMELVPNSFYSKTKGIFIPDNFITMGAYAFAGFYSLLEYCFGGTDFSIGGDPQIAERAKIMLYGILIGAPILIGVVANKQRFCTGTKPEIFARVIDSEIEKLGLLEEK